MLFTVIQKSVPPDAEPRHHSLHVTLFHHFSPCLLWPSAKSITVCFYILLTVFYSPVKPRKLLQKTHASPLMFVFAWQLTGICQHSYRDKDFWTRLLLESTTARHKTKGSQRRTEVKNNKKGQMKTFLSWSNPFLIEKNITAMFSKGPSSVPRAPIGSSGDWLIRSDGLNPENSGSGTVAPEFKWTESAFSIAWQNLDDRWRVSWLPDHCSSY